MNILSKKRINGKKSNNLILVKTFYSVKSYKKETEDKQIIYKSIVKRAN